MKPLRTIKLNGKRWRITRDKRHAGDDKDWSGYCDHRKHIIYLNPELVGDKLLEVAVHESLHAQLEILEEEVIDRVAASTARLLQRLGFSEHLADRKTDLGNTR